MPVKSPSRDLAIISVTKKYDILNDIALIFKGPSRRPESWAQKSGDDPR